MKSLWLAMSISIAIGPSCKKDKNENPLLVDKTEIDLSGRENSTASIQITTSTSWKITAEGNAAWVQIEPSSGKGNATVQIKNKTGNYSDVAEVTLVVSGEGSAPINLKLTRKPLYFKPVLNTIGGSRDEQFNQGMATPDGGYIVVGYTQSINYDFSDNAGNERTAIAVKYSPSGAVEWKKYYGGNRNDVFTAVIGTNDGGYLMVGSSNSNSGNDFPGERDWNDYWIVKTDKDGNKLWSKLYGSRATDDGYACVAVNGGYIIAGVANGVGIDIPENFGNSDAWVIKLDLTGNIVWKKSFGGLDHDGAKALVNTPDGNCVLAGNYGSDNGEGSDGAQGSQDAWLLKFDPATGNKIWSKRYGGSQVDVLYNVQTTQNGDLIASGTSNSSDKQVEGMNHGDEDGLVIKANASGVFQWAALIGGQYGDRIQSTFIDGDNGFIAAGFSNSEELAGYKGNSDIMLSWLDQQGKTYHTRLIGSKDEDVSNFLLKTTNNKYVTGGYFSAGNEDFTTHRGSSDCWSVMFH